MSEAPIERGSNPIMDEVLGSTPSSALQAREDAIVLGTSTNSILDYENGSGVGDSGGSCTGSTVSEADNVAATTDADDSRASVVVGKKPSHPSQESGCLCCNKNDRLDRMLLCDGCDGEYHTFCVKPRLSKVPSSEWYCKKCKTAGKGPSPKASSVPVSKYNGVYWARSMRGGTRNGMWTAKILRRSGRNLATIGMFSSEKEAAEAYDAEAIRVFDDDHPPLNFPNGTREDEHSGSEQSAQCGQRSQQMQALKMTPSARSAQSTKPVQLAKDLHVAKATEAIKLAQAAKEAAKVSRAKKVGQEAKRPPFAKALHPALDGQPTFPVESMETGLRHSQTDQQAQRVQSGHMAPTEAIALPAAIAQSSLAAQSHLSARLEPVALPAGDSQSRPAAQPNRPKHLLETAQPGQGQEFGPSQHLEQPYYRGHDSPPDKNDNDAIPAKDASWVNISASGDQDTSVRDSGPGSLTGGSSFEAIVPAPREDANAHPGVEITQKVASESPATGKLAVVNPLQETSGVPGNPHVINAVATARSKVNGADTSAGGAWRSSQQSGSIPGHDEGAKERASSPVSIQRKLHNGSPTSGTLHGRKRVKTKWLQEYELDAANVLGESSSKALGIPATLKAPPIQIETSGSMGDGKLSGVGGRNPSASASDPRSAPDGTPLGAEVKSVSKGKGKGKFKADGKKSFPWGVKDWRGHAASNKGLEQIKGSVKVWMESKDGTIVGEDGNHFFCSACGEHGEVTCCDGCARVFHEECLKLGSDSQLAAEHQTEVDPWYCPACVHVGRINLVRGEEPFWGRERHEENEKHNVVKGVAGKSRQACSNEKDPATTKIAKKRRTSRARVVTPTMASESDAEPEPELEPVTATAINIADAVDKPKCVSRVKVFSPELDNCLLRSLLYDETYNHVMPRLLASKKSKAGRGKMPDAKKTIKGVGQEIEGCEEEGDEEEETRQKKKRGKGKGFYTAGTHKGESSVVAGVRTELGPDAPLGVGTEHSSHFRKAGTRLENPEQVDGVKLGSIFGLPSGSSGVLDGTAVTFGARAMGPFRHGLAATMVEVGLVPKEEAMKTGYAEIVATEKAIAKKAVEKTEDNPFGSAKVEWTSRIPSSDWGLAYRDQQLKLQGGDASNHPRVEAAGEESNDPRAGVDFGKKWSRPVVPNGRSTPLGDQVMCSDPRRGAFTDLRRMPMTKDYMDVDTEVDQSSAGSVFDRRRAEKETSELAVNRRHSSVGPLSAPPRINRDGDGARASFKRSSEPDRGVTRKENRRWNLKHIRAMNDDGGKMEICSICRIRPPDALMVCPSNDMAKIHSFCFPCLEAKESILKKKITTGIIKWDCPTCRERRERPQRRAQTPAALRGSAWAGGGFLKSPCAVPSDVAHGKQSRGGSRRSRSKDTDRSVSGAGSNPAGTRGLKRSLSGNELQGSTRRTSGRVSPFSFPRTSTNEDEEAGTFRLDKIDNRFSATDGGNGSGDGEGCDRRENGGESVNNGGRQPALPGMLERRRLLRMVVTMALDRLQDIDSLNVLKGLVADASEGYTETIRCPIDLSTIRRRLQWGLYESLTDLAEEVKLLCKKTMEFNSPGTVSYTAATDVQEASKRLWPHAQDLLDSLLSTEMAAAKYRLLGPASTSAAWPLDGPFTGFELTPANEDAYYMHVTIKRVAAAVRAREDYERKLGKGGSAKRQAALAAEDGWGNPRTDIVEAGNQLTAKQEKRAKELEKTAAVAASSPALLYTCGELLEEESILRDSLSALRTTAKEDTQSKRSDLSAKCTPIDSVTLGMREEVMREMPTPVTRREVAPDGEFLEHDPSSNQSEPLGPNPSLEEGLRGNIPASVVPEWKVLRSAQDLKEPNGLELATRTRAFQELFIAVGMVNRTRLGVGMSTIRGVGVFAYEGIRARELVAEYVGERVTMKEAKRRLESYRRDNIPDYLVRLDENNFVDATHKGNVARFLNHSCAPNCYMKTVVAGKYSEEMRICIFSMRNIRKGEEITYSYLPANKVGLEDAVAGACACRAPGCRGRMSSREQR